MPQKSNHDFKEKYPYIWAGTFEPMRTKVILAKHRFFCHTPPVFNTGKTHKDMKFGKEVKMIIVVDISLHSLMVYFFESHHYLHKVDA